jgi:hypothetical protein
LGWGCCIVLVLSGLRIEIAIATKIACQLRQRHGGGSAEETLLAAGLKLNPSVKQQTQSIDLT